MHTGRMYLYIDIFKEKGRLMINQLLSIAIIALGIVAFQPSTAYSESHKDKMGHIFEKLDADGDGQISSGEFAAMSEERFKKMDIDGDGFLTKDEMKQGHTNVKSSMKKKWKSRKQGSESGSVVPDSSE